VTDRHAQTKFYPNWRSFTEDMTRTLDCLFFWDTVYISSHWFRSTLVRRWHARCWF